MKGWKERKVKCKRIEEKETEEAYDDLPACLSFKCANTKKSKAKSINTEKEKNILNT